MDAATRAALEDSIAHWQQIYAAEFADINLDANQCALCRTFNVPDPVTLKLACTGCPVRDRTDQPLCYHTPYYEARRWYEQWKIERGEPGMTGCPESTIAEFFRAAASRELAFLESLREVSA